MFNENQIQKSKKYNRILKLAGTIFTLLLFFYLFSQQDWEKVLSRLQHLSIPIVISVWLLFSSRIIVNAVRWFTILKASRIDISYFETLKIFILGMFVSNFLPSTIGGDGIRYLALLRFEKDKSKALSSIISDRLVNIFAMLLLLPVSAVLFYDPLVALLDSKITGGILFTSIRTKINNWKSSAKDFFKQILFLFESPGQLFLSFIFSWSAQFLYFWGLWLLAQNLGMSISYFQVIGITALSYLVTLLPISINGYGVREITITSLYSTLGFPIEGAITLALISRLIYMITTLPGAIWLPENLSLLSDTSGSK